MNNRYGIIAHLQRTFFSFKLLLLFMLCTPFFSMAQVPTNGPTISAHSGQNSFIDGSTYFSDVSSSLGKGIVFPTTDLTKFKFITYLISDIDYPTALDGMVVYNVGTGQTLSGQGVQTAVNPGFYYFSNPGGRTTQTITNGKWVRMNDTNDVTTGASVYYGVLATTTPTATDIQALTTKTLGSGSYDGSFNQSLASAGYFTVALPVSWRNPALKIGGDDTWNVLNPTLLVTINNISYQVWQTDVSLPSGQTVAIK